VRTGARLDRLAERLSGSDRSAFLRASLAVERTNRLRHLAAIAERHAADQGVTDEKLLDAIKNSYKWR
jgi:predicted transcriptional regulator